VRRLFVSVLVLSAFFASNSRAEVSPPPHVPTLASVEWTVGLGLLGTSNDTHAAVTLGFSIPAARVGSETELYVGLETAVSPVWSPFVVVVPVFGKAYVRFRLSDATGVRFGIVSGALLSLGQGVNASFVVLGAPAFDLAFTKSTRVLFEPQLGVSISSAATNFLYFPRVSVGFSL